MRELTYYVAVSLDGRIAAPDGTWDAFLTEGDHLAALAAEYTDTVPAHVQRLIGVQSTQDRFDTVVMGWNTYLPGLEEGHPSPYSHLRQVVFSRTRTEAHPDIELTSEDPVEVVRRLKREEGKGIYLCGGGQLAGALIEEIDRLVLKVNPIVLGDGIPLFAGDYTPRRFALESTRRFELGVLLNEYLPKDRASAGGGRTERQYPERVDPCPHLVESGPGLVAPGPCELTPV